MRLFAALALGLAWLPACACAQSTDPAAEAQRRFRALVEGPGALGTRFAVDHDPDPCYTAYGTISAGQSAAQAIAAGAAIDWRQAAKIAFVPGSSSNPWWKDYVTIVHVDRSGAWHLHPTPEKVGPLLAAGNELIRLCKGRKPRIYPLPIGRELRVTADMVWVNNEDFFFKYYYQAKLAGRRGDRFRIAWRGTEPVQLEYDDDAYEVEYPKGATIFDKASSLIVTLTADGEYVLSFSEIGAGFKDTGPSTSLAGPSLEGRHKRPFAPFSITAQKLN